MPKEIEIKFRIEDLSALTRSLKQAGFKQLTRSTHEMNSLYDLPGQKLRKRGEMLRLRKYGETWVLTHKAKSKAGRHKVRVELETRIENGEQMDALLRALGFAPTFRYEKYRAEWSDGTGHVVLDETPIGNFGEIEGLPHSARARYRPGRLHHSDLRSYVLCLEAPHAQQSHRDDVSCAPQGIKSVSPPRRRERREKSGRQ
jgi:adenylate cyclase class 2